MKKVILTIGILVVIAVTIGTFFKDNIIYEYNVVTVKNNFSNIDTNSYYLQDNFSYVENYSDLNIKSKNDLINYIYYALNTGTTYIERYADKSYTNYLEELNTLTEADGLSEIVSILNDFVHPFNSSKNMNISYSESGKIALDIKKVYSNEEIDTINQIVNNVIENNIKSNMTTWEKIKVIHDYIINNTEYDKLKYENIYDTTYKSNTAYGVLIEGYGTCSGYADTMAIFLNKLGIVNYKISNQEHIWNLVYLNGSWYHLDATWDDPISEANINRDTYFLINYNTLKELDDNVHYFNKYIYPEGLN